MTGIPVDPDDLTAAVQDTRKGILVLSLKRLFSPAFFLRLLQLKADRILSETELCSGKIHRRDGIAFCQHAISGETALRIPMKLIQILTKMDPVQKRIGIPSGIDIGNL